MRDSSSASSVTITDRNGNRRTISEPLFGRLMYGYENGRLTIKRISFWGFYRVIIPSIDDSVDIAMR
jgi:hypothetical protein